MSQEINFLESLIRQSSLSPKGTIMGKKQVNTSKNSGFQMPWDEGADPIVDKKDNNLIVESVQKFENTKPKVSLALKLGTISRNLKNLSSEIK